jgi:hypothetical protein
MISFFEKTWFLWWMFAVVVILRWHHVLSAYPGSESLDSPKQEQSELGAAVSGKFASRA